MIFLPFKLRNTIQLNHAHTVEISLKTNTKVYNHYDNQQIDNYD
jgi:hypothetical protein